jgi:hypothetical protein
MLENSINYGTKFQYAPARDFASFIRTMNMATQIFAVDANANDVQATGVAAMVVNGVPGVFGATAALDISADVQLTIWLTAQSYTTAHMRYVVNPSTGNKQWYKCIVDHTSAAANKPDENDLREDALWKTYWTRSTQTAEQASGDIIPNLSSRYYLALCNHTADSLTLVKAGDIALDADVELVIPNFEPEMFVAIGHLLINSAGFVLGTTSTASVSTFTQIIGPVFPTGAGIDQN